MASDEELDELLIATARHDRAAFRLLYDRTSPKLFGIALKICRNRAMAEDVLQDVFTEIWSKAGSFDRARGQAGGWLSVIARNRSIDALRRQGSGFLGVGTGSEEEMIAVPDPALARDGGVEYLTLVDCLNQMEARERDLVLRAYYLGETREDMARAIDAPVNTIKTWLRRGLISLKACLGD